MDFETRAIHAGQEPDPTTGAITVPIHQTSTYVQEAVGENKGYDYSRAANPTRSALETCLASLEGAEHGVAFGSGLGATTTLMHLLNPGDRIVAVDDVLHSTTKYLGGHSDLIGGFLATNDPTIAERLYFLQMSLGAIPGPFDCWLVLRGLKTLSVRMRQHCANAHAIAGFLERHPRVEKVLYPGLPHHPGHAVAARQMRDFGGMISFLAESEEEAIGLVARTKIWKLAESLGGVESLIEVPARMTHASTVDSPFAAPGNLVRISVGLESADDLLADLEVALAISAEATQAHS